MIDNNIPLICDPVPSTDLTMGVLLMDRQLTNQEITNLRALWELSNSTGGMIILPEGVSFVSIFVEKQWPDAEFCAA